MLHTQVKRAKINSTDQETAVVAAVAGHKIRVLSYVLTAANTTTLQWDSGAVAGSETLLSGPMNLIAGTPVQASYNPHGHFETVKGEALYIYKGGDVDVNGHLTYVEVESI